MREDIVMYRNYENKRVDNIDGGAEVQAELNVFEIYTKNKL